MQIKGDSMLFYSRYSFIIVAFGNCLTLLIWLFVVLEDWGWCSSGDVLAASLGVFDETFYMLKNKLKMAS